MVEDGTWRMWYVSGTEWTETPEGPRHHYLIKYAESRDGLRWERTGIVCLDYRSEEEFAFGRPCVLRDGNLYRMWYSYRGPYYRIGYAESADGIVWTRLDSTSVVPPSSSGWDSEMTTYPVVVRRGDRLYMLYNGNGYGRTGIGLALGDRLWHAPATPTMLTTCWPISWPRSRGTSGFAPGAGSWSG